MTDSKKLWALLLGLVAVAYVLALVVHWEGVPPPSLPPWTPEPVEVVADGQQVIGANSGEVMFTVEQMQEALEGQWHDLVGDEGLMVIETEVVPDDFNRFVDAQLAPRGGKVAFTVQGPYISLSDFAVVGHYDQRTKAYVFAAEVLPGYPDREPRWAPDAGHFALTLATAKGPGNYLVVVEDSGQVLRLSDEVFAESVPEAAPDDIYIKGFRWLTTGELEVTIADKELEGPEWETVVDVGTGDVRLR